jgi:hypothetical protein
MSPFPALCFFNIFNYMNTADFFLYERECIEKKEKRTAKKCSRDTIEINKKEQTCVEVEI